MKPAPDWLGCGRTITQTSWDDFMAAQNAHFVKIGAEVVIRVPRSRRRLKRLEQALGRKPQYLYSFRFDGNFARLQHTEYDRIKADKRIGITRAHVDQSKLLEC